MTTDTNTFTLQSQGKDIVLNRMYTGSYLSSNLGHEVINMFQADNDKHYLYLNSKGNFSKDGASVSTMLLVRGIGEKRVEIIGLAKDLKFVKSAKCTLPRDLGRVNKKIQSQQLAYMEDITYGGAAIKDIFGDEGQQSVFISYETDASNFYLPATGKRIIINFSSDKTEYNKDTGETYLSLNFASTSLHQFVREIPNDEDWKALNEVCNDKTLWEYDTKKAEVPKDLSEQQDSLFDICRIQDDENKFSNALCYFIEKYPKIWINFFKKYYKIKLSKIDSVTREEDAKVENNKSTGGRIDLLIRTPEYYIVIENKIDSSIIEEGGLSQIQRYYNYVRWLKEKAINDLNDELTTIKTRKEKRDDQYEKLHYKEGKRGYDWEKELRELNDQIRRLESDLSQAKNRQFKGFVLCPNYNKPKLEKLKVGEDKYELLLYSDIYTWLDENAMCTIDVDPNFKDFHNAMKKHTYNTKSEAIREDMKNTFFTRIQNAPKASSKTNENA